MSSRLLKICLIFIAFLFFSCSSSDDSTPSEPDRSYEDVKTDFQAIDFQTGVNDVSIRDINGVLRFFRVIIPEGDLSSNLRPLVMTLHGASGGNPDAHKNTGCFAEEGFAAINPIIISPNGGNLDWIEFANQVLVLSLFDLAINYLPVDDTKVVVNGYSNGGNGAWFYGETQPTVVTASIPMASSYNTFNTAGEARRIDVPMYVIHGENDELFPLQRTQNWVEATRSAGTEITLEVAPGLTHNEPCNYVDHVKNAAIWLENDVWD
ncbi:dienelactone hydrolase family protein [Gramella lutea]|uniref:Dienelactone hydrolase family protein n=1 Tax=Christiangramia lutea TaxID=1607951 RepID=A0A9X1V3A3_9FLAO|nr:dienelactone hydrolase family protein [Christiangramia lutea]MCH4823597.1 dienelactone hydrolase family protein [Christiangramia lutea]